MKPLIILLILSLAVQVNAQYFSGIGATVNAGYWRVPGAERSMSGLVSDSLSFLKGFTTVGIDVFYFRKHSVVTGSAYMGFQSKQLFKGNIVEPFMWSTHAGFGWIVSRTRNWQTYPAIGLGATGLDLITYEKTSYRTVKEFRTVAPSIDLSCTVSCLLSSHVGDQGEEGIVFSVKVGYLRALSDATWKLPSESFHHIRPSQLQGWQFAVSVGGLGSFRRR